MGLSIKPNGFLGPVVGNGGFASAAQNLSPLAFAMAAGLRSGQGAAAYAPQGLAAMMAMQEKKEAGAKERREEAFRKEEAARAERMTADALRMAQGRPTQNQALSAGGPTVGAANSMGGRDQFIAEMWPHALRVSEATGLDPRLVVAQAAQETGWGQSAPNNNYFGIKSHGVPGGTTLSTKEYVAGQPVTMNDSFRGYGGMGESADDYANFLKTNPRYGDLLNAQGLDAQVTALGASGYATDPNYAASVGSIARGIQPPTSAQPRISPERAAAIINNPNIPAATKQLVLAQFQPNTQKPSAFREKFDMARSLGYSDQEALEYARGGQTINVGPQGPQPITAKPEPGVQRIWDEEAGTFRDSLIPGSKAHMSAQAEAIERAQSGAQEAEKNRQQTLKLGTSLTSLNLNIAEIENGGLPVTGVGGALRRTGVGRFFTGEDAMDVQNRTDQITDSAALAEIQRMRDNSPTGGAVGALTDGERVAIGNAVTALSTATSDTEYLRAAKAYRKLALDLSYGEGNWRLEGDEVIVTPQGEAPTVDGVPEGVDPMDWEFMPPELRALWQN